MMRELSDNILDIAENSVAAGATLVEITVTVDRAEDRLTMAFADNGKGMTREWAKAVLDPFSTSRKTRKVGLGLPLLKQTAEATGGSVAIESEVGKGTLVTAVFGLSHIDRPPLGDLPGTFFSLIYLNPEIDFRLTYGEDGHAFTFDTRPVRETVSPLPFTQPEISAWIRESLMEGLTQEHGGLFQ